MLAETWTALALLVPVLAVWVAVQLGWRRVFGRSGGDPDVLAGRMGCGGCARPDED